LVIPGTMLRWYQRVVAKHWKGPAPNWTCRAPVCQRKMQGQHSHGVAYYRCRFAHEYALANHVDHPRNVIMREDAVINPLDVWLTQEFSTTHRARAIADLANQAARENPPPVFHLDDEIVSECDAKLARYRAALDAGGDPTVIAAWIAETQAQRRRATAQRQQEAAAAPHVQPLTADQIAAIFDELGDLVAALREAEPEDKLEVYRELGLQLIYDPHTHTVHAKINLGAHRWDLVRVRGATRPKTQRHLACVIQGDR
jgi:hypothetical protein